MPELAFPWLAALLVVALPFAIATFAMHDELALRRAHVAFGLVVLGLSVGPLAELTARSEIALVDPLVPVGPIDELSAALLPFGSLLFAFAAVLRPRAECTALAIRRSFIAEVVVLALFLSRSPLVLGAFWIALVFVLLWDTRDGHHRRALTLASRYLGLSSFLVGIGVLAMSFGDLVDPRVADAGLLLVAIGAMIRKGIVPFHSWIPELFEHGKLGPTLLFSAPQIAAYTIVRLVVPAAPDGLLTTISALSIFTAVYGAAAFVVQRDARRAFGYLFMSQSALVMAGLESTSIGGLVGGICLWLSSGVALAGMGFTIWLLEARRGRLSIDRLHGGYEDKPLLAISFLVLGLASIGFPGTLGFVAEELLIDDALARFPLVGLTVILASSLSAIGVLRMYFALFCGKGVARVRTQLRRRELFVMASLVLVLLGFGLFPQPITALEARVAADVLARRAERIAERD